jgi:predicted phage terminase large subunit-like protein
MISTPRGMNPFRDYYIEAQRDGIAFSAPSTVNPHLKASEFEKLRRSTPPLVFEEEYLARFVQMGGALLKKEHIRYVEKAPRLESMSISFGIDLALRTDGKSDYSAIVVCGKASGDDRTYVLHCDRWRATWPETVAKLANYNRAWSPEICGIENYLFQELTVRDLLKVGLPMHALKSSKGKEERFLLLTTPYALGLVHHVESLRGSEFEMELTAFPESAHDDWCDALVYGYAVLNRELRVAMSEQDGGYLNWGHRLKAEIDTRLFHGDGSYDVIEEQPDGEAEMVHRNPDGSEFDDTWHHELVGDECVIFEGGKEISRHPRWHLPILLEARRLAYREKYNGRKVN